MIIEKTKEMTVEELKKEIDGRGDFIQMEKLNTILKQKISQQVKRFAFMRLAEIYERRIMYSDAARMCHNLAVHSVAFSEKNRYHVKEAELYIRAGKYDLVEEAMKKAMSDANSSEKAEIFFMIKDFYKREAQTLEIKRRKSHAAEIYERILRMEISSIEKREIKKKLLELYDNLGRVKDYLRLKREIE